jgi:hypothetical protein
MHTAVLIILFLVCFACAVLSPVVLTLIELAWSAGSKSTWLNWHCAGKVPEESSPQGSGVHCTRAIQAVYAFRIMNYAPHHYV